MSHDYTLEYQLRDTRLELGRITAQLLQTIDDLRKIKSAHREHVSQLENDYRYELSRVKAEKDVQATQLKRALEDAETQRDAWRNREADVAEQLEQSKLEMRDLQEELDKMRMENEILKVEQDEARTPVDSPSTPHGKRKGKFGSLCHPFCSVHDDTLCLGRTDSLLGIAASPMNIVEEESSSIPWPTSFENSTPVKQHVPYPTPPFKRHRHYVSVSKPGSSLFVPPAPGNQTNDSEDDISTSSVRSSLLEPSFVRGLWFLWLLRFRRPPRLPPAEHSQRSYALQFVICQANRRGARSSKGRKLLCERQLLHQLRLSCAAWAVLRSVLSDPNSLVRKVSS